MIQWLTIGNENAYNNDPRCLHNLPEAIKKSSLLEDKEVMSMLIDQDKIMYITVDPDFFLGFNDRRR